MWTALGVTRNTTVGSTASVSRWWCRPRRDRWCFRSNHLGETVEYDEEGHRTGRRFLCPENPRNNGRPKTKPCNADASRAQSRARRAAEEIPGESQRLACVRPAQPDGGTLQ